MSLEKAVVIVSLFVLSISQFVLAWHNKGEPMSFVLIAFGILFFLGAGWKLTNATRSTS